ncbi:MAG: VOC family protein [Anaerolineae bacterium]|nr:VOC family protein [Anaerolineae bacterium]
MNLNYIIVYANDINKMTKFYIEALGMSIVEAHSSPTFVTLSSDSGAMIGLQDKSASQLPPRDETQPGTVELSFAADDVDATWKQWQQNGVEMITEPLDLPFGRYFMAKDVEGHYLSVYRFRS